MVWCGVEWRREKGSGPVRIRLNGERMGEKVRGGEGERRGGEGERWEGGERKEMRKRGGEGKSE